MEDGETEGKEGCVYYYVRVGGEATWFPTFTEEDAQVLLGKGMKHPEALWEIVEIEFGGDVMLAEMVEFQYSAFVELLKSWEEDKEMRERVTWVKLSWWEFGMEEYEEEESATDAEGERTEFRRTDFTLGSVLDVLPKGNANVLVGRWSSADVFFSVEDSGAVRAYMRLLYDERKGEDKFFLHRSDGESLEIVASDR